MLKKEIKIPMITGVILYAVALIIDLTTVIMQRNVYRLMESDSLTYAFKESVFPLISVYQIVVMVMYILFMIVMFSYKGSAKRAVGIVMTAVYCVLSVAYPFIGNYVQMLAAKLKSSLELAAVSGLTSYISMYTSPFVIVSSVFIIIAIGRYGMIRTDKNTDIQI